MRTVTFQSVLHGIARLLGLDPARDLNSVRAATLTAYVNDRLGEGWQFEFWPEWTPVEQRWFRPFFSRTEAITAGDQRFDPGSQQYYQALRDQSALVQPPATYSSGVWTVNDAYWAVLAGSYSGAADWQAGEAIDVGDQRRDPRSNLFYQCHTAHTAGSSMDLTQFGLLTAFERYLAFDADPATQTPDPNLVSGSLALADGVNSGSITGLALDSVPVLVSAWVVRPAGGLNLNATPVLLSYTTDGFDFDLDGFTDSANYVLHYEVLTLAASPATGAGTLALANGVENGSVTGLNLGVAPTVVRAWIMRPAGGLNIEAFPLTGTLTTDGFDFELSGITDSDEYVLAYEVWPAQVVEPVTSAATTIGEVKRVCWRDPRVFAENAGDFRFSITKSGVQIWPGRTGSYGAGWPPSESFPVSVWLEFRERPPVFTSTPRSNTATYASGVTVYDAETGDCWTSNDDIAAGESPTTDPDKWDLLEFPLILAPWVKKAAHADALRDQKQTDRADDQLAEAREELADRRDRELGSQSQYDTALVCAYQ